jgi:PAS domain S-box-containing protein
MKALFCIAIAVLAILILARLVVKSAKSRNARMAGVVQGAYSFLADAMPQIVWTAKPDGNLDYSNRRWFDYTGMTIEETKDWGWKRVVHPDDVQNCIERWTKAFTTACDYEIEYRFKRAADGAYRWHLGRAFPLRNQSGEVVQWVGTCTDIDDQKRACHEFERKVMESSLELAETREKLQAALDVAAPPYQLDDEALQTLMGYGENVLPELIELFVESAPPTIAEMQSAIEKSSAAELSVAGHTLKGSCSNFGASPLREVCAQIEKTGHSGNIDGAADLVVSAEKELHRLVEALKPYRKVKIPQ